MSKRLSEKNLIILTFIDKPLGEDNFLVKSCNEHNLNLEIVTVEEWPYNSIKIRLLHDFLEDQPDDQLILFVDALDVYFCSGEKEILEKFRSFDSDIVFSAEANFMFHNSWLRKTYWQKYPVGPTIYDFLNSGSFMGNSLSMKQMIRSMVEDYDLDIQSIGHDHSIQSDQTLYHRFYVDQFHKKEETM